MTFWFQLAQLAFALFVAGVIAERVHALYWRDATSEDAVRWLARSVRQGDRDGPLRWARDRPRTFVGRVITRALTPGADDDDALDELLADLREEAVARLLFVRVAATLASTTGLLGGILLLAGAEDPRVGLMRLRAGAAERLAVTDAITTMAIGVAISALCFQALALLRPAAQKLMSQVQQVARAASSRDQVAS